MGPSNSGEPAEFRVRFRDGVVDEWAISDLRRRETCETNGGDIGTMFTVRAAMWATDQLNQARRMEEVRAASRRSEMWMMRSTEMKRGMPHLEHFFSYDVEVTKSW